MVLLKRCSTRRMEHLKVAENFPNSTIKRTSCIIICESEDFPYSVGSAYRLKGKRVVDKLYLFLKNIKKVLKFLEGLSKSKLPKWTSYETVLDNTND